VPPVGAAVWVPNSVTAFDLLNLQEKARWERIFI
jgi:hypothetical protein